MNVKIDAADRPDMTPIAVQLIHAAIVTHGQVVRQRLLGQMTAAALSHLTSVIQKIERTTNEAEKLSDDMEETILAEVREYATTVFPGVSIVIEP